MAEDCKLSALYKPKCLHEPYCDMMICCAANHLAYAANEVMQCIPIVGSLFPDYSCKSYEPDFKERSESE